MLNEVLGTLQAIGDQWYRFHGPLRAESLASDGTVLYTIDSKCHRITWLQVKTRKQRCLSDVFFFNELVFCDAEICKQSCLSKSMAEIQPALTLAAEEKAVSVMCLRWVLLFIEEVMHHEQQNASWTTCPKMLLLEAIPCYKNVTTIFSLMPRNAVSTVNNDCKTGTTR